MADHPFFEFEVGARKVRCFIEQSGRAMSVVRFEWDPDVPDTDKWSESERAQYENGRMAATVEFLGQFTKRRQ